MYLHLGQDVTVQKKSIIGIFDMDNASYSHITRNFLSHAEKAGQIVDISGELPRSFVLCDEKTPNVYLSQLSSQTLLKRSEENGFE